MRFKTELYRWAWTLRYVGFTETLHQILRYGKRQLAHPNPAYSLPIVTSQLQMRFDFAAESNPQLPLVAPYKYSRYQRSLQAEWISLLNQDKEFGDFTALQLTEEIMRWLVPDGAIFVLLDGRIVATAALCSLPCDMPRATLMYVIVAHEHRGKKLGAVVTAAALAKAQREGYAGVVLRTDDHRLAAIRTYLKVGFKPAFRVDDESASLRWANIQTRCGG